LYDHRSICNILIAVTLGYFHFVSLGFVCEFTGEGWEGRIFKKKKVTSGRIEEFERGGFWGVDFRGFI
jgi:hypothetical protein